MYNPRMNDMLDFICVGPVDLEICNAMLYRLSFSDLPDLVECLVMFYVLL